MADNDSRPALVLASASRARRSLLAAAGLEFEAIASSIDEAAVASGLGAADGEIAGEDLAEILARAKAEEVSERTPDRFVIGGDQVLTVDGRQLSKPESIDGVRDQLLSLRGRTHELASAVVLAEAGETVWNHVEIARVTLRDFSMKALGAYLAASGEHVVGSVGGYQLEGAGVQLIERVEGDYFTVLGLPLLPLLAELRRRRLILE
ncbi:MAG: Maf family nucleotide pyrophosphatase [Hyphomicrobiaceae bacterium]